MDMRVTKISLTVLMLLSSGVQAGAGQSSAAGIALGPSSVLSQIQEIEQARKTEADYWPSFPSFEEYNLSVAADYQILAQQISSSPSEKDAMSGVARFYGTWKIAPESSAPRWVTFKVEHRHRLGSGLDPKSLLPSAGVASASGPTFSDKKGVLTNLYWGQSFQQNEFGYIVGIIDVADFIDVYGLVNVWTEFNNLAFATNPTIPVAAQGLGAAGRWLMPSNYYITGSIADSNGDPHNQQDAFDSFFNTSEYLSHLEFGHIGSWEDRWANNVHVTLWHVDEREEVNVASDKGITASVSQRYENWLPFFRVGFADRGVSAQKKSISTGTGYAIEGTKNYIGVGISWGQAAINVRNQYTMETYYKWQVFSHVLLVPSIQWINHPSYYEAKDNLWLAALKARVTF